jgi:hypothetical protein
VSPGEPTLRAVTINVLDSNSRFDRLLAFIDEVRPDVLALEEWTERDPAAAGQLDALFPAGGRKDQAELRALGGHQFQWTHSRHCRGCRGGLDDSSTLQCHADNSPQCQSA